MTRVQFSHVICRFVINHTIILNFLIASDEAPQSTLGVFFFTMYRYLLYWICFFSECMTMNCVCIKYVMLLNIVRKSRTIIVILDTKNGCDSC